MSRFLVVLVLAASWLAVAAEPEAKPPEPVYGAFETTLATEAEKVPGPAQIRMFAMDGDPNTYFASKGDAGASDHFTLVLEKPVTLTSVAVVTGRVKETDLLDKGTLQISEDGKEFVDLAKFGADGKIKADGKGKKVLALRLKPSEDLKHPLAVREFTIESNPPVAVFKYPVEVFTVCEDDPTLKEWTEKTARVMEQQYQMICEYLKSEGNTPKTVCKMTIKNDKGVAYTAGSNIVGHVGYFKTRQNDVGAMVHEMVHFAQAYRGRRNPGWLVEGLADFMRCYKYEGGKLRPLNASAKYDGSYQITAHFLNYVQNKYNKELISKLNKAMREGNYAEGIWKELTQKTVEELGQEWKEACVPAAPAKKPDAPAKKPDAAEKKPETSEKKPDATEKKPDTVEKKPDVSEKKPTP